MTTTSRSQIVGATGATLLLLGFVLIMTASETSFADDGLLSFRGNRKMLMASHMATVQTELLNPSSLAALPTFKSRSLQTILPGLAAESSDLMEGSSDGVAADAGAHLP